MVDYICDWIVDMLNSNTITSELGKSRFSKNVRRATSLHYIVINKILLLLEAKGLKVVTYADDVINIVFEKFLDIMGDNVRCTGYVSYMGQMSSGLVLNP